MPPGSGPGATAPTRSSTPSAAPSTASRRRQASVTATARRRIIAGPSAPIRPCSRRIKERIREGRWEVVGGWPVEPDCNIPSTESFVRHCLYGKEYCRRALGVDVKIAMNPDSFGHAAGLPTILKSAGYGYYAFMRPQEHEMHLPHLFWWEGPDGSRILTMRIWKDYDPGNKIRRDDPRRAGTTLHPGISIMPPCLSA